jgi:hypothetical protein
MNIGTYLYLIILFVVFSPGILFSVSSSKWVRVFTHGFLFSVTWLLTHRTVNNIWNKSVREGVDVQGKDGTTPYSAPAPLPPLPKQPPTQQTGSMKCHANHGFCVTTQTDAQNTKLNYYCMGLGQNGGCNWSGRGEGTCKKDSDCQHFDINSSLKYAETDCSKVNGGWPQWVCDNTAPSGWKSPYKEPKA